MKEFHFCKSLLIFFLLSLTICPSSFATLTPTIIETPLLAGCLENGLTYTLMNLPKSKGKVFIHISCSFSDEKDRAAVSLLTQHALFYGTDNYSRDELAAKLNDLGLDIEADSYLFNQHFQFSLSEGSPQQIREILGLLNQMIFHPTFNHEEIELARCHLVKKMNQSEVKILPIQCVTTSELKSFHTEFYRPENIHLTMIGMENSTEILTFLAESFGSKIQTNKEIFIPSSNKLQSKETLNQEKAAFFMEKVNWSADQHTLVVDEKIWMKEPTWLNNSNNGRALGALLTILGIGGIFLAFPIAVPSLIIAGALSSGCGIHFLTSGYLKDPYYIESIRKTDLLAGCLSIYKKGRAGITLTPYERRASFLQEMVDHPDNLPQPPILILSDVYQLNDPIIAEIFTIDEFNVVSRLKRDFIQQRNQYKLLKENLEKDLAILSVPYAHARDASILQAQEIFNQNFYVVSKGNLKAQRDVRLAEVEKAFADDEISLDEKKEMIAQVLKDFDACLSSPEFKNGLNSAEMNLAQAELKIKAIYSQQVEAIKQSIQFNQRMEYYNQGEHSIINYFNQELRTLLATFPVYSPLFPDFLDLRDVQ